LNLKNLSFDLNLELASSKILLHDLDARIACKVNEPNFKATSRRWPKEENAQELAKLLDYNCAGLFPAPSRTLLFSVELPPLSCLSFVGKKRWQGKKVFSYTFQPKYLRIRLDDPALLRTIAKLLSPYAILNQRPGRKRPKSVQKVEKRKNNQYLLRLCHLGTLYDLLSHLSPYLKNERQKRLVSTYLEELEVYNLVTQEDSFCSRRMLIFPNGARTRQRNLKNIL